MSCLATRPTSCGFSLAAFLLPLAPYLTAAFLPGVFSSIFATVLVPVLTFAEAPLSLASSFVYSLQSEVYDPLVSWLAFSPSSFAAIPISIGALVSCFLPLAVGTIATLSTMMFSSSFL